MHPQDESEHAAEAPVGGEAAAEVGGGRVSVFLVLLFAFASFTLLLPVVCLRPALGFFSVLASVFLSFGTASGNVFDDWTAPQRAGDVSRVRLALLLKSPDTRVPLFVSLSFLLVILAPPFPILLILDSRSAHSRGCGWVG
jgi:hypothetical protein